MISNAIFLLALFGGCFESRVLGDSKIGGQNYLAVQVTNHCDTIVSLASPLRYSVLGKNNGRLFYYTCSYEENSDSSAPKIRFLPSSSIDVLLLFPVGKSKPKHLSVSIF